MVHCFALLCILILAGAGCSWKSDSTVPPGAGTATEKITMCQGGGLAILPLIALEKGLFARQGLNVEIIAKGDGKLAFDALLSGECAFATVGEPPLVAAIFTRTDFAVLASLNITDNATKVLARKDLGIRTVNDLKGKPVGVRKGTFSHYFLDLLLTKNGISPRDVSLRFMEPGRFSEALAQGEIVAYSGSDEQLLLGKKLIGEMAVILSEPGLSLNSVNLVTMKKYISSRPAMTQKLLQALLQAEEYYLKHPADARNIVQRLKGISPTELEEILKEQNHQLTLPQSLLLTMEGNARWMIDTGIQGSSSFPNFLNVIDPAPLKALKPSSVSINK
ncbi:MAG: ABC transporter substrate-binding protein [Desulfuromonadales bacterium]